MRARNADNLYLVCVLCVHCPHSEFQLGFRCAADLRAEMMLVPQKMRRIVRVRGVVCGQSLENYSEENMSVLVTMIRERANRLKDT